MWRKRTSGAVGGGCGELRRDGEASESAIEMLEKPDGERNEMMPEDETMLESRESREITMKNEGALREGDCWTGSELARGHLDGEKHVSYGSEKSISGGESAASKRPVCVFCCWILYSTSGRGTIVFRWAADGGGDGDRRR